MFKFLIILGLILYIIYKIGSMFFRAGAASQQFRNQQQQRRNFDANGNPTTEKRKKGSNFKGGEYIDYEEIK
ncbi:hypothetical protein KK083_31000 [Fulvivirgaceae bacterium PWU4]|uniref:DUF4834 domain-containing protein n=1 Tax=Chryseosolibacter histidini TaxID=2782349 RepID=A0AAP2GT74_9BACT|nr:hypothetical protein [Chryseosolibacter histidini]MBT1701362.1 hypothetical protein [Chryseosolibacter histidini]